MEKLIEGSNVKNSKSFSCKTKIGQCSSVVKKGHEECGDSAFIYMDDEKAIIAVLDGVSGEPGAASASSDAAAAMLKLLRKQKKADEKIMKKAFMAGSKAVSYGYTTASVCFVQKNGSAMVASTGDSPIYGIDKRGRISLELPLGRAVGDNDSIFKFFFFRNLVTSVIGPSGTPINMHTKTGKLKKGDILIIASDGLTDNLYMEVENGYVKDSSGCHDLKRLIGKSKNPKPIVTKLMKELKKRIEGEKKEVNNTVLVPKKDDIAIAVFKKA